MEIVYSLEKKNYARTKLIVYVGIHVQFLVFSVISCEYVF